MKLKKKLFQRKTMLDYFDFRTDLLAVHVVQYQELLQVNRRFSPSRKGHWKIKLEITKLICSKCCILISVVTVSSLFQFKARSNNHTSLIFRGLPLRSYLFIVSNAFLTNSSSLNSTTLQENKVQSIKV